MSEVKIWNLLEAAIRSKASDLFLVPGSRPTLAVNGKLQALETKFLSAEDTAAVVKQLAPGAYQHKLNEVGMVDLAFFYEPRNRTFRVNIAKEVKGNVLTLRLVSENVPTPEELGLGREIIELMTRPQGLLLATGPTGSGKSTTLASLMNFAAQKLGKAISTVEQPIEYQIQARNEPPVSIVRQFDVPQHVHSFKEALRGILRQAPNIIMIGELRDWETIEIAVHSAETGHLVLSTLHTNSAADAVNRMVSVCPADKQEQIKITLGATLLGVIAQRLLPRADGSGRVMAHELLLKHTALPNLIQKGNLAGIESLIQTNRKLGMVTFDDHLHSLVEAGTVTFETAKEVARRPAEFAARR